MSDVLILRGPHFSTRVERSEWTPEAVGLKARGLIRLPVVWTPPFLVMTTATFHLWKGTSSKEALRQLFALDLAPILGLEPGRLIVRSSASAETIDRRGWLESVLCAAAEEDVLKAADRIWAKARDLPKITGNGFGLVVQQFKAPRLHGHLSNERRVSRDRGSWLCEVETPMAGAEPRALRLRVKAAAIKDGAQPLFCSTQEQLIRRLEDVACWCLLAKERSHLEWVWDGGRLWIVQGDLEHEIRGSRPACSPIPPPLLAFQPPRLRLFDSGASVTNWKKTESLRILSEAGMKVAQLYVLQKPGVLRALAAGRVSKVLKGDVKRLLESPIVFRTDFHTQGIMPKLLSARSHTLYSLEEATTWLVDKARKIVLEGTATDDFCFIAHRYIPARSGALCLARPDRQQVHIDATWGFPDGLLWFPHDTFHLCSDGRGKIGRRIRCKPFCLSEDGQGNWVPRRCPAPWDWRSCLEDSEIREIARMSRAVAACLKRPVEVMFFVGVDERTGHPPVVPWIHFEDTPAPKEKADHFHYAGKSFTITDEADLKRLEPSITEARRTADVAIDLRPAPSLLRDKEFVEIVAEAAMRLDVAVQLQGSILSHLYYMLTLRGVKVRCIDAAPAPRHRQRFGKLVRDLVDVKIRAGGEIARSFQVPKDALIRLLKAKALEEAFELFRSEDPALAFEELADILEVLWSACRAYDRSFDELTRLAQKKREERGGFEKGVVLVETEAVPLLDVSASEPALFGGAEPASKQSRKRRHKSAEAPFSLGRPRSPRVRGRDIAIPMIPPHPAETDVQTVLALPDGEHEAVIRYMAKEVLIELRRKPAGPANPNQTWFDFR